MTCIDLNTYNCGHHILQKPDVRMPIEIKGADEEEVKIDPLAAYITFILILVQLFL